MEKILFRTNPEEKSVSPRPVPSSPFPTRAGLGAGPGPRVAPAPHVPADPALGAVVLLLVAVEQVADPAVILAEEAVATLAALLGLPPHRGGEKNRGNGREVRDRRPPPPPQNGGGATPKMAAPPAHPTGPTFCRRRQRVHCTSATRNRSSRCPSAPSWHSRQAYSFPQHGACQRYGTARQHPQRPLPATPADRPTDPPLCPATASPSAGSPAGNARSPPPPRPPPWPPTPRPARPLRFRFRPAAATAAALPAPGGGGPLTPAPGPAGPPACSGGSV